MLENKEIRNLKEGTLYTVIQILDINDDWKRFMSLIPMDPQKENSDLKYNNEHIRLIEDHAKQTGEKCAKILFDEWGTSGQIRPTLKTLQKIALKADMMRVADEIAHLLGEDPPPRPQRGPGAPVTDSVSLLLKETSPEIRDTTAQMRSKKDETNDLPTDSTRQFNIPNFHMLLKSGSSGNSSGHSDNNDTTRRQAPESSDQQPNFEPDYQVSLPNMSIFDIATENSALTGRIDKSILQDNKLIQFDYKELEAITGRFCEPYKIGSGGFGEVFIANHPTYGLLAIKKSHMEQQQEVMIKTFNLEVKMLSQLRHENVVPILGFSKNGPVPCIICEYIDGGSLYVKIDERSLTEKQRIDIMRGTAGGLQYLHTASVEDPSARSVTKTNFVHGDVKSANILLTQNYVPKLCDFGLSKQYEHTCRTLNPMGTPAYTAPEAFQGTVTQKSDVYSYGIVLLELLTGLRPLVNDPTRDGEKIQIKHYIDDGIVQGKSIRDFLDSSAVWTRADEIYALAQRCLQYDRHVRPSSEVICDVLSAFD